MGQALLRIESIPARQTAQRLFRLQRFRFSGVARIRRQAQDEANPSRTHSLTQSLTKGEAACAKAVSNL